MFRSKPTSHILKKNNIKFILYYYLYNIIIINKNFDIITIFYFFIEVFRFLPYTF